MLGTRQQQSCADSIDSGYRPRIYALFFENIIYPGRYERLEKQIHMNLDIRTLLLGVVIVSTVYGWGLLLYRTQQNTFPGFGFWTASFYTFALAYTFLLIREAIPLGLSIILGNACFMLAVLLRLDGVLRFTRNIPLKKIYYAIMIPFVVLIMIYCYWYPNILARTFIIGVFTSAIAAIISYIFFTTAPPSNKKIFYATGSITALLGLALLLGPILFRIPASEDIFTLGNRYAAYYLIILGFEISWGTCLLMINNQRVEDELRATEKELRISNAQLEQAIREKNTLSGLLPICAHCKKIRDDKGYWNNLETYIETHSEADFSHSICPECAQKYYPDLHLPDNKS